MNKKQQDESVYYLEEINNLSLNWHTIDFTVDNNHIILKTKRKQKPSYIPFDTPVLLNTLFINETDLLSFVPLNPEEKNFKLLEHYIYYIKGSNRNIYMALVHFDDQHKIKQLIVLENFNTIVHKVPILVEFAKSNNDRNSCLFCMSTHSNKIYFNQNIKHIVDHNTNNRESLSDLYNSLIHPDDEENLLEVRKQSHIKKYYNLFYRIILPNHKIKWVQEQGFTIPNRHESDYSTLGFIKDVTKQKELELENLKKDTLIETVLYSTKLFVLENDWRTNLDKALNKIGRALDVSRVYVFKAHLNQSNQKAMTQLFEWTKSNVKKEIKNPLLQNLEYESSVYEGWVEKLSEGTVVQHVVQELPNEERGLLEIQNIKSILLTPILIKDKFWGFIGIDECLYNRVFTKIEIKILTTIAELIGYSFKNFIAKENLISARNRMDLISNGILDGILLFSNENLIDFNQNTLEILEFTPEELFQVFNPENYHPLYIKLLSIIKKQNKNDEINIISGKGRQITIEILYKSPEDSYPIHTFTFRDITKIKDSEKKLKDNLELSELINFISSKLIYLEESSSIQTLHCVYKAILNYTNSCAYAIYEYNNQQDTYNKSFSYVVKDKSLDKLPKKISNKIIIKSLTNSSFKIIHQKKSDFDLLPMKSLWEKETKGIDLSEIVIICDQNRPPKTIILFLNSPSKDEWSKKELEAFINSGSLITSALTRMEKNSEFIKAQEIATNARLIAGEILNRVTSEIINPFYTILGYTNIIIENDDLDKKQKKVYSELIQNTGHHLSVIINKIQEASFIELNQYDEQYSEFSPISLLNSIIDQLEPYIVNNSTHIFTDFSHELSHLRCTTIKNMVHIILYNIIENAITFSPGGKVNIKLEYINSNVKFIISDEGPGINNKYKNKIFDRFFKIKHPEYPYGGAGLGLYISKYYTNKLNGKLWYTTKRGVGTTFYFTFPVTLSENPYQILKSISSSFQWRDKNVLVFTPFRMSCDYYEAKLGPFKSNLVWIKDKEELMQLIKNDTVVDLILLSLAGDNEEEKEVKEEINTINSGITVLTNKELKSLILNSKGDIKDFSQIKHKD
ncbi:MAG: ATP-binding protein [Hyphomicrobiales bacterium]